MKKLFIISSIILISCLQVFAEIKILPIKDVVKMYKKEVGIKEIEELLKNGVNSKDDDGDTVLMRASVYGYIELVKSLIANRANVNAKVSDGRTTLIYAARYGHTDIVKLLKYAGAK